MWNIINGNLKETYGRSNVVSNNSRYVNDTKNDVRIEDSEAFRFDIKANKCT